MRLKSVFVAPPTGKGLRPSYERRRGVAHVLRPLGPTPVLVLIWGASLLSGPRAVVEPPKIAPSGFVLAAPPEFYGTEVEPMADGHIFQFIDGGGVVYLRHGFRAVVHVVYRDDRSGRVIVDIFDMGSPANARAAWTDEAICPSGFVLVPIGTETKIYHFEPDFFLYFVKGRFLFYVHASDDSYSEELIEYARRLYKEEP